VGHGRGQAPLRSERRTCPLRQLQAYPPPKQHATLRPQLAVTAVTGYPSFFGCRVRAASSSARRSQQVMRLLRGYTISSRTSFFGSHL